MFFDKLEERHEVNRKALESALSSLLSILGPQADKSASGSNARLAVNAILRYYNHEKDFIDAEINNLDDIESYLQLHGMMCTRIALKGKWWKDCSGPLLVRKNDGEVVALLPRAFGYVMYTGSSYVRFRPGMAKDMTCEALSFFRNLPPWKLSKKDFYRFCVSSVPGWDFAVVFLFCTVATLLNMLVPVANKVLFNDVIPSGVARGILPICGLLLASGISAILFGLCRNFTLDRMKDRLNANVQPAVMARLLYLPSSFFKKYSSGDLGMRVLSINNIYQLVTNRVMALLATAIFSVMYVFIVIFYAKRMFPVVLLILLMAVVVVIVLYLYQKKDYSLKIPRSIIARDFTYSALLGIQKIKNNRAEFRVFSQWAARYSQSETMVKYVKLLGVAFTSLGMFLVYFGAWHTGLALSDYVAFMSAFGIMSAAINEAFVALETITSVSPYVDLLEPILQAQPEIRRNCPVVETISGSIEISHVSFRYSADSPKVLDDVSISIKAGEYVGLVGSSGCGKSTLMRLMLGFEKPDQGAIFYGQYNVDNVNLGSLRQFVGFCPQAMQIFPGTIADNIRFGAVGSTDEQVWEAARIAAIDEDIRKMPLGMDTMLGEGGSGLSGGQCQRLLIARAVISKPRVLFMDEATSALDNITQRKVVENLNSFGCTRIAIAHRLSTIMHCDRIIALDKGKIVEEGSPAELLEKKGFFYQLSQRQQ